MWIAAGAENLPFNFATPNFKPRHPRQLIIKDTTTVCAPRDLGYRSYPTKGLEENQSIQGPDRDRSGDVPNLEKRENVKQKKAIRFGRGC